MPQVSQEQLMDQVRTRAQSLAPPRLQSVKRTAVAVVGIAVLVALWFTRSPGGVIAPPAASPSPPPVASAVAGSADGAVDGSAQSTGQVVVHVSGSVRQPGLVRLAPGARVLDAITAAGGLVSASDAESLNLARPVVDGEQIVAGAGVGAPADGGAAPPEEIGGARAGGLINLNTADANLLQELPGVGPVLAGRIVDWRTKNGPFRSVDDLGEVSGIGESRLAELRDLVRVA